MHIIVHPTGRNSFEFSVPLKLRRAYTVLQIIQCPGSTPAEAPGVSKKIRTCTVNSLHACAPPGGAAVVATGAGVDQLERNSMNRNTATCTVYACVAFGCNCSAASVYG